MMADNARCKKRANMSVKMHIQRYHNGTILLTRADGSIWFGLWRHLRNHL
jgi:hypothetical protein